MERQSDVVKQLKHHKQTSSSHICGLYYQTGCDSPVSIMSLSVGIDFIASMLASVFKELKNTINSLSCRIVNM